MNLRWLTLSKRPLLRTVLRSAISIALAALLVRLTVRSTGVDVVEQVKRSCLPMLLLGVLGYVGVLILNMVRWRLLLRVQGIHVAFSQAARLIMTGVFFNLAVPGGTGGDVVRMAYVSRLAGEGRRTEAVFSVIVDRLVGVVALCLVASCAVLLSLDVLLGLDDSYAAVRFGAFFVAIMGAACVLAVLAVEHHQRLLRAPGIRHAVDLGSRVLPHRVSQTVARMTAALDLYRRRRRAIAAAGAISLIMQVLLALVLYVLGHAVGETVVSVREYFMTMQVSNTVGAIPITPAGVGTRDVVIAHFLQAFGATAEHAGVVPVLFTGILVAGGLVGGVVFALAPGGARASENSSATPE